MKQDWGIQTPHEVSGYLLGKCQGRKRKGFAWFPFSWLYLFRVGTQVPYFQEAICDHSSTKWMWVMGLEVQRCFHSTKFLRRSQSPSESKSSIVQSWPCWVLAVTLWPHRISASLHFVIYNTGWKQNPSLAVLRGLTWKVSAVCVTGPTCDRQWLCVTDVTSLLFSLCFIYSVLDKILFLWKKNWLCWIK